MEVCFKLIGMFLNKCSLIRGMVQTRKGIPNLLISRPPDKHSFARALSYESYNEMHYSFKNLLLNFQAQIRQTKCMVIINKEWSTKIVYFMTLGAGVLVLGGCHLSHVVKIIISLKIFFSTTMHRSDKLSIW